ncbi:hypothetical protein HID58_052350 [Brassica napus]|uniref:HTH three-helical bundle domain-containing protein n=1 Tax=Brassica napus TaxID=3708 RepID=A0ABQ8ABP9_BRANA|nr:hypothetical protein HID58_052350 [Brassica napus]
MTEFPSSIESEVASSLLLLSSDPIVFSSRSSDRSGSEEGNRSLCGEIDGQVSMSFVSKRSCDSAISNSGSSYRKRSEDDFMNFKIARKRRTNVVYSSVDSKLVTHSKNREIDDLSKEESCLSTGSNEVSSTESRIIAASCEKPHRDSKKKESHRSSSIRRKAGKIMEFLDTSASSELKIRQVLGDNADTSKALRMLVKIGYVKRSGAGGKHHPFIYKVQIWWITKSLVENDDWSHFILLLLRPSVYTRYEFILLRLIKSSESELSASPERPVKRLGVSETHNVFDFNRW